MHNKIGQKIPTYVQQHIVSVKYPDNFFRGELVSYKNKFVFKRFFKPII